MAGANGGGPIEFLGEEPGHHVPGTEMGGVSGLIQPERAEILLGDPAASGGHALTESEVAAVMGRVARIPQTSLAGGAIVVSDGDAVVDPLTGREVPAELNKKSTADPESGGGRAGGSVGELSDLKP